MGVQVIGSHYIFFSCDGVLIFSRVAMPCTVYLPYGHWPCFKVPMAQGIVVMVMCLCLGMGRHSTRYKREKKRRLRARKKLQRSEVCVLLFFQNHMPFDSMT